ncbi:MAG TPA: glycine--tRNA ligase subunit beta [Steroidobacteraceae bacterium]|nr:glycine--tRNA ligase subunit beta [Steroidobacteraceae bacterium]
MSLADLRTDDFLVELGTEELPPLALPELEQAFANGIRGGLAEAGIPLGELKSFATPRRLAVLVRGLAAMQPAQALKLKGPPVNAAFDKAGKPTAAATKFAEKCGVAVDALKRVTEGKGEFLYFEGEKAGLATVSLLPGIVQRSLDALPIPKRMRWGSSSAEFVRPVHWLVLLYGGEIIPAKILDTDSGRATRGHRFMAPGDLALAKPADYERTLREQGKVVADFSARRAQIRAQVVAAAGTVSGEALLDEQLLDEVTALVEWPTAIAGAYESRFLELPREVLISTLQQHQRYFAVQTPAGKLLPNFITVSNIESREPAKVRAGNERVVRPRLSDGAFFWGQDRKQKLADRRPALDAVTFQAKLGSVGDKVRRVGTLAGEIALLIDADQAAAVRAAELAKCDLLSNMVGEFPELQGIMGRYYAIADGEPAEVSAAIDEHYLPRGAGGALPGTGAGVAVALADKLDTLAGIFSIGQKPSGTKDPFGLRRAAIGVLRILVEKKIDVDLRSLVTRACALQPVQTATASSEVWDYIVERLRAYLGDASGDAGKGITTEMFDAVRAGEPASPLDFVARLDALVAFLALPEAASLTAANKRIANILRKSTSVTPDDARASPVASQVELLREPAEKALHEALAEALPDVERALGKSVAAKRDYGAALTRLAKLRPAVDAFFDGVLVNADDPALRNNRLALLAQLRGLFTRIADLSCLPG